MYKLKIIFDIIISFHHSLSYYKHIYSGEAKGAKGTIAPSP